MWLATSGSPWTARFLVTVDNSANASTADKDAALTIGPQAAAFWAAVDSSGYQVRFTKADGVSVLQHKRHAWDYANQTATFHILGDSGAVAWGPPVGNEMAVLVCYVGLGGAADTAVATASSSPLTAHLHSERPRGALPFTPERPGATRPQVRRAKTSDERLVLWLALGGVLSAAMRKINNSPTFEELLYADVSSESEGSGASLESEAGTRFVWFQGEPYLRVVMTGGSDDTDYTVKIKLGTCSPDEALVQTLQMRVLVLVRNVSDQG